MSSREWPQRIEDILIAAREILQITAGMTLADWVHLTFALGAIIFALLLIANC